MDNAEDRDDAPVNQVDNPVSSEEDLAQARAIEFGHATPQGGVRGQVLRGGNQAVNEMEAWTEESRAMKSSIS